MLVIIGDLHLSDNSLTQSVDPAACCLLRNQLTELVSRASWRTDHCYRPLDRRDIILLGDTLDLLHSDYWLKHQVRPWPDAYLRKTVDAVSIITDRILKANREFTQSLRELTIVPAARVSTSQKNGEDRHSAQSAEPIAIHVHYMVGENDWQLHLPGASYDLLRQKVIQTLGLANPFDRPFPYWPDDSRELKQILQMHRVYAHHGSQHDPIFHVNTSSQACLTHVLSIELLQRFVMETIESAGSGLPKALVARLLELFDCRPIRDIAWRLNGLLSESIRSQSLLRKYCAIWNTAVDNALQVYQQFHLAVDANSETVNRLAADLQIQSHASDEQPNFIPSQDDVNSEALRNRALAEPELQSGRAHHVVYGHLHQQEHVVLQSELQETGLVEQNYFNCGTWRPTFPQPPNIFRPSVVSPRQQMSLLVFYKEDERSGRPYETWHGTLAPPRKATAQVINRKPENSFRAVRSLVKASMMGRPHFLASAESQRIQNFIPSRKNS